MRRGGLFLAALVLLLGAAACGGGGDRELDVAGIGITFAYPPELEPISSISFARAAGARAAARGGVALDKDNAIIVSRYDLKLPITARNLASFERVVDTVIGKVAGKEVSGRRVEYGGLPGFEYTVSLGTPAEGNSTMVVLFDRATEYLVNCQSTPAGRDTIGAACRKALDTLERK